MEIVEGFKKYEQLNDSQKEDAREKHPTDYLDWEYQTIGVCIQFSVKGGC